MKIICLVSSRHSNLESTLRLRPDVALCCVRIDLKRQDLFNLF